MQTNRLIIKKNKEVVNLRQGLQTFLPENHTCHYPTVRGSDILRNVTVSGYNILPDQQILREYNVMFFHYTM